MRYQFKFFLFLCISLHVQAQIEFFKLPSQLQLFPRDKNNFGNFEIKGRAKAHVKLRTKVSEMSSGKGIEALAIELDSAEFFTIKHKIPAGLKEYKLELFATHGSQQEQKIDSVFHLVAGDFFIVSGQSNATGAMGFNEEGYWEDSTYSNHFCRTIGTIFQRAVSINQLTKKPNLSEEEDYAFGYPSAIYDAFGTKGCIGLWPLRILHKVITQTGIPICIVNSAMGASALSNHFASHTPSDPMRLNAGQDSLHPETPSIYDRLFKKLFVNDAAAGVKAIFWYQGESDAVFNEEFAEQYNQRFALLRDSWKKDFPNLEKIFVLQINTGCGAPHLGIVREQQRRMPQIFNDVVVMSTVGSAAEDRSSDLCHYSFAGAQKIGENLGPVVLKYLYNIDLDEKIIMPPYIKKVYYSKPDEICLSFNKAVSVQQLTEMAGGTNYITESFYRKNRIPLKLKSVMATDSNVYLQLQDTLVEVTRLTYLPDNTSTAPGLYTGPWILNKLNANIGALSFYEMPVEPFPNFFWADKSDSLVVYPNPVTDFVAVRSKDNITLRQLSLYDSNGKRLMEFKNNGQTGILIDMREYEDGLYFIKHFSNRGMLVKKIILQKRKG